MDDNQMNSDEYLAVCGRLVELEKEVRRLRNMLAASNREEVQRSKKPDADDIETAAIATLCAGEAFDISPVLIEGKSRLYSVAIPRHVSRYLLHTIGLTPSRIARANSISVNTAANSVDVIRGLERHPKYCDRIAAAVRLFGKERSNE